MTTAIDDDEPELLTGVVAIGEFFGWPPRRVSYMIATGQLPCAFRIGGRWHMRPATGRAWLASLERRSRGPADAA